MSEIEITGFDLIFQKYISDLEKDKKEAETLEEEMIYSSAICRLLFLKDELEELLF